MPPLFILKMFAGPIGNLINTALQAGSAAILAWSVAKGNPLGDLTGILAQGVLYISTAISAAAASQGVQIPVINAKNNGVVVVPATPGNKRQAVDGPLDPSQVGSG